MNKSKKITKIILVVFLTVTAILTFFSSTINNMGINTVVTTKALSGKLRWTVSKEGAIMSASYINIFPDQPLKINEVHVKEGDAVKKGDILISFDISDLEESIEDRRLQYQRNELQIKKLGLKSEEPYEEPETGFLKLASDREAALRNIEDDYEYARLELEREISALEEGYSSAEILYGVGAEPLENLTRIENDIKSAKTRLSKLLSDKEKEKENIIKEYQAGEEALMESIKADEAVKRQKATVDKQTDLDIQSLMLDQQAILTEIGRLTEIIKKSGAVYAPEDIHIEEVYVEKGMVAAIGVSMIKAYEQDSGVYAYFEVDGEEAKHVFQGMKVTLTSVISSKLQTDGVVDIVRMPEGGDGSQREVLVRGDFELFKTGDRIILTVLHKSFSHPYVVPLTAVHGTGEDAFVYVVRERGNSIRTEYFLQMTPVIVDETDGYMAAVQGLNVADQVVVASKNPIFAGEKVRVADKIK